MNQYDISSALARRLEMNQYDNVFNDDIFWSEETNFSFFVYSDNSYSFQMTVGYF
jgi:hypothetical protein